MYRSDVKRDFSLIRFVVRIEETSQMVINDYCNIRLLQSHMRLKKNRPYNHWLKSQGHYLLCFCTSNQSEPIRFACDMRLRPVTA